MVIFQTGRLLHYVALMALVPTHQDPAILFMKSIRFSIDYKIDNDFAHEAWCDSALH